VLHDIPIDLFVFDLDHTALGGYEPYERLPDRFSRFLDALASRGVAWATNTTWSPYKQAGLIAASDVQSRPTMLIGATGMMAARFAPDGQTVELIPEWQTAAAAASEEFISRTAPAVEEALTAEFGSNVAIHYDREEPRYRSIAVGSRHRERVMVRLREHVAEGAPIHVESTEESTVVRYMPAMMTKGRALCALQKQLGADRSRALVAGDGMNDLTMLDSALARYLVCPSNACAAVRERVRRCGGAVGEGDYSDGVLDAIGELFPDGEFMSENGTL